MKCPLIFNKIVELCSEIRYSHYGPKYNKKVKNVKKGLEHATIT